MWTRPLWLCVCLIVGSSTLWVGGTSWSEPRSEEKKVLVLGVDGLDPTILTELMEAGQLPNFKRLKEAGDFRPLGTSIPPLSPVAWSDFITGMDGGGHGIFDFIHRDPATMEPYLSTSRTREAENVWQIGKWMIPLQSARVELLRRGRAFWETLAAAGVPATIVGIPANFPPVASRARALSGMGTPDILGTYGIFSLYTDDAPPGEATDLAGGRIIPVSVIDHRIDAELRGPPNVFHKDRPSSYVPLQVWIDPELPVARIVLQDHEILLNEGEWSDWVGVSFPMIPMVKNTYGICRFFLKSVHPRFELYVSPVNLDPLDPALPISTPPSYATELARSVGRFYTQGMPEDTKAYNSEVLGHEDFLEQSRMVLAERVAILKHELGRFQKGVLFFHLFSADPISHMFWWAADPKHPAHEKDLRKKYGNAITATYREVDRTLGFVLRGLGSNSTLIVMSDHGFAPFYRQFNLNGWLRDNGYLVLLEERKAPLDDGLPNIFGSANWGRTRAYGVGINGLYVNLKGRERDGIVDSAQRQELVDEIAQKLLAIRDDASGESVISRVYQPRDIFSGAYVAQAPDLIIGYNRGFRASNKTAVGDVEKGIISDNRSRWSGDHAMAAHLVPGVLMSNKKIKVAEPNLRDVTVSVLAEFGLEKSEDMKGRPLF